mmetsp:Transcript_37936/g.118348  ORF Transcript_37936/g.118348 Transcript_37936/m.118348 type:complete len:565 (+) Transcript_37936:1-1695(+)
MFSKREFAPGETVLEETPMFTRPSPEVVAKREWSEAWEEAFSKISAPLTFPGEAPTDAKMRANPAMVRNALGFATATPKVRRELLKLWHPPLDSDHPIVRVAQKLAQVCIEHLEECAGLKVAELQAAMLAIEMNIFTGGHVFQLFSRVNHSCFPNTVYIASKEGRRLRALRRIAEGEQLVHCYLGEEQLVPTELRRRHLWRSKCFRCVCERCTAEADPFRDMPCRACAATHGTYVSKWRAPQTRRLAPQQAVHGRVQGRLRRHRLRGDGHGQDAGQVGGARGEQLDPHRRHELGPRDALLAHEPRQGGGGSELDKLLGRVSRLLLPPQRQARTEVRGRRAAEGLGRHAVVPPAGALPHGPVGEHPLRALPGRPLALLPVRPRGARRDTPVRGADLGSSGRAHLLLAGAHREHGGLPDRQEKGQHPPHRPRFLVGCLGPRRDRHAGAGPLALGGAVGADPRHRRDLVVPAARQPQGSLPGTPQRLAFAVEMVPGPQAGAGALCLVLRATGAVQLHPQGRRVDEEGDGQLEGVRAAHGQLPAVEDLRDGGHRELGVRCTCVFACAR